MLLLQQVQQVRRRANAEQPLDRVEDDVNSALRSHGDPRNFRPQKAQKTQKKRHFLQERRIASSWRTSDFAIAVTTCDALMAGRGSRGPVHPRASPLAP